jgi:hypothetical protein
MGTPPTRRNSTSSLTVRTMGCLSARPAGASRLSREGRGRYVLAPLVPLLGFSLASSASLLRRSVPCCLSREGRDQRDAARSAAERVNNKLRMTTDRVAVAGWPRPLSARPGGPRASPARGEAERNPRNVACQTRQMTARGEKKKGAVACSADALPATFVCRTMRRFRRGRSGGTGPRGLLR